MILGEFKENKNKLARSLVEGTASYGMGRTVEFSDGEDLDFLTQQLMTEDMRARSLIHNLVQSKLFQTK